MAERSFAKEVQSLRLGDGEEFHGEGILAVTKALLQSGVAYVGGYQGAPISHLMDVLADAEAILNELGVHFEASASEATAAAMLSASINYPLRGAVTWKSTVGTNVASDALANLASVGREGRGAHHSRRGLRRRREHHAGADPCVCDEVADVAPRSAAASPGDRACRRAGLRAVGSQQYAGHADAAHPRMSCLRPLHDEEQPPAGVLGRGRSGGAFAGLQPHHPAALDLRAGEAKRSRCACPRRCDSLPSAGSTNSSTREAGDIGIVLQGGLYNNTLRALELLDCADAFGNSKVPLYLLNVTYPLVPEEWVKFCSGKRAVLVVEEGQPEFIEQAASQILRQHDVNARIVGKDVLPMFGEYSVDVLRTGRGGIPRAMGAATVRRRRDCRGSQD